MTHRSETRLVDPTRAELERVVADRLSDANATGQTGVLKGLPGFDDWFTDRGGAPAGWRQWNGPDPVTSLYSRTVLALAWWTDHLDRVHYLIVAGRRRWSQDQLQCLFAPYGGDTPLPLEMVYPGTVFLRKRGAPRSLWRILCRCGAAGTADSLAWMGECCGPCHDRSLEGLPPSQPGYLWAGPFPGFGTKALSAEARFFAVGESKRVEVHERESGASPGVLRLGGRLHALRFHPDRPWLATAARGQDGLLLWDIPTRQVRTRFDKAHNVESVEFSTDGSLVRGRANGQLAIWDLETGKRLPAELAEGTGGLFAGTRAEALCQEVVFGNHSLLPAADGRSVAVIEANGWTHLWSLESFALLWEERGGR
jgi:hypothetical protein